MVVEGEGSWMGREGRFDGKWIAERMGENMEYGWKR
jgi:hypothetical protein